VVVIWPPETVVEKLRTEQTGLLPANLAARAPETAPSLGEIGLSGAILLAFPALGPFRLVNVVVIWLDRLVERWLVSNHRPVDPWRPDPEEVHWSDLVEAPTLQLLLWPVEQLVAPCGEAWPGPWSLV
jgi:hypothetical protein